MNFYNYLNESMVGLNEKAFQKVVEDCKPYLKELKKINYENFLFSGRTGKYEKFNKKKIRKRRKPKDTPLSVHKILDKAFNDKFGVKARSEGFFTTILPFTVTEYGTPHYVFPVGNYNLIYSYKIDDLYRYLARNVTEMLNMDMESIASYFDENKKEDEFYENGRSVYRDEWEDTMSEIIKKAMKTYKKTKKIPVDLPADYEIMLIADSVRLLKWEAGYGSKFEPLLKEWIDNAV